MPRNLLHRIGTASFVIVALAMPAVSSADDLVPPAGETLPGTERLTIQAPLDEVMVDGINAFALEELAAAPERREAKWQRNFESADAYEESVADNRDRFRTVIGAVDERVVGPGFELIATTQRDSVLARPVEYATVMSRTGYVVHAVRWRVLDGVTAEGILLQPMKAPRARIIALPDADWTPEMFAGIAPGVEPPSQIPRRLAESGVQVVIPMLISRDDRYSGSPFVAYTNQPHREFIYRMAFELGRHIIGYEVQKVCAAVDQFVRLNEAEGNDLPIGVAGIGEGGLLALASAAVDRRIDAALVSGYFEEREGVWEEPIYRNVWRLVSEFGDAELAGLIAPRGLVVEAASAPEVAGPPEPRPGRRGGAAPGRIRTPPLDSVQKEFDRARKWYDRLGLRGQLSLVVSGEDGHGAPGSAAGLTAFLQAMNFPAKLSKNGTPPELTGVSVDARDRQKRQFDELVDFTQALLRRCAKVRDEYWSQADRSSVDGWVKSAERYRAEVYDRLIGRLPDSTMPPNVRTRQVLDEPAYRGYEVVLDVYPNVIAAGILLLPRDLKSGERRPVVVCQHGLEGTPMDTITTDPDSRAFRAYKAFSVQLVKRGFIVYAPQNPYRGQDRFRTIQRKSNPLGRSLFSYIIPQHERTLEWLSSLPYVDPERIGFYGLSYGGKTAVRVPPLVPQYALSICSADFNEWVKKNASNEDRYSYIFTGEYEIFEWNMGHVANYAELSSLMVPRPFMVERGHRDGVAPDEWVAWEFAKVRRHYDELGLGDRTEIEFFNGPHTINGKGTFAFLHRHLDWPNPEGDTSE